MVGLERTLQAGDEVILSTGATAKVRRTYPQGYTGLVEFELDGRIESDEAGTLTLPDARSAEDR